MDAHALRHALARTHARDDIPTAKRVLPERRVHFRGTSTDPEVAARWYFTVRFSHEALLSAPGTTPIKPIRQP